MKLNNLLDQQIELVQKISDHCANGQHEQAMELANKIISPHMKARAKALVERSKQIAEDAKK